ncbi:1-deoxy-D-xylulose-5-phosphate synthase [candidate division KSB1 bacterium]|nr:MAG: 1-deoxy-D-xylulose-5-phosphate synthase [candidate division KSB1 bacterium]
MGDHDLLKKVNFPSDIKKMSSEELKQLAEELREFIIDSVSETGGHLAPSLGVVELTLALHKVFNAPEDKIVWDVGHQAYVHKIITGRKDKFHTLRQYNGISGFPKITESEYDTFGVGHSSTSISAALGMAAARDLLREKYKVVAVIGDGALTGGVAFEGLNNAGGMKKDMIVILNDNEMSISRNVGAVSDYFTKVITNPLYNRIKKDVWDLTGKIPMGTKFVRESVQRVQDGIKTMITPGALFERFGFRYFGPVDGHDIARLVKVLNEIKRLKGPILLHIKTIKGKGYKFAERDATKFHGLGSFNPETGLSKKKKRITYTEVFGKTLTELAEKDERIIGITAAMADGTGMIHLKNKFKNRFFDVGIAEQHAVVFAGAMALQGMKPVVAIYSTFLQRAYDQVIHDVALQKLPVVFALDRGGIVGEDGPTHHGSFDLSYLRLVPNMVIMAPKDENELRHMLFTAVNYKKGPVAIRYPRGEGVGVEFDSSLNEIPIGTSEVLKEGKNAAIISIGDMVHPSMVAAEKLSKKGYDVAVVNARFVKPLDREGLISVIRKVPVVVTVENNSIIGGLGSSVSDILAEEKIDVRFKKIGIPDKFVAHGPVAKLLEDLALDSDGIVRSVESFINS